MWGARATDIRPGDLVISGWKDDGEDGEIILHHKEYEVMEMAEFKDPMMSTLRVGFIASNGKFGSVGMLQPMQSASMEQWQQARGQYLGGRRRPRRQTVSRQVIQVRMRQTCTRRCRTRARASSRRLHTGEQSGPDNPAPGSQWSKR